MAREEDAISSAPAHANAGACRRAHKQTVGISTTDGQNTLSDSCAEWPERSSHKMVGEKIGY